MFERFTEKAIKVIILAQEESRRLGHNFVGSEQILLGLIGEGHGVAALTLKSCGVTLSSARTEVEKVLGQGHGFVAIEIPFTTDGKKLLERSWDQARQMGHNYIGTEHLLMGLIVAHTEYNETTGGVTVLRNLGVDFATIRSQISYIEREVTDHSAYLGIFDRLFRPGGRSWLAILIALVLGSNKKIVNPFSESASTVLHLAREKSRESGRRCIGSDQILLAILEDDNSVAASFMKEAGVTRDAVKQALSELIGAGPGDSPKDLEYTPRAYQIIDIAHREARHQNKPETTAEHLLFGILSEQAGNAHDVLVKLGVDAHRLQKRLREGSF